METASERRLRKLMALAADPARGGIRGIASRARINYQTLDQIIKGIPHPPKKDGTQSPRNVGNSVARKIEAGEQLGDGWFDADDVATPAPPPDQFEQLLLDTFRKLTSLNDKHAAIVAVNKILTDREPATTKASKHNPFPGRVPLPQPKASPAASSKSKGSKQ